jgi:hypothetical protein
MPGTDESVAPGSPASRAGTASSFMTGRSSFRGTETFNLEPEPINNEGFLDKAYPSVCDYYEAKGKRYNADPDKPINLLGGLSNYSGLKLGDHRITFGESVLSASYRIPVEHLMSIDAPSKGQTKHTRKREYKAALEKVGDAEINRLERVMKDKLFQRSYATSSPFQVRKAFKFFDRECTLKIPIEGFTRALEFLGFQFAELQNLALFAKYDSDFTGDIDYMTFIASAMFYPAVEPDFGQANFATPKVVKAEVDNSVYIEVSSRMSSERVLINVFVRVGTYGCVA